MKDDKDEFINQLRDARKSEYEVSTSETLKIHIQYIMKSVCASK